ncbi:multiple inositol polyphosphate phosphatase 2 isoform X2 [Arctopsyche grandis]|uniref:multiple inositol polyphosphate phosphatase 2 isoform X2 n=1 Tax=Arctopsyche grandis TaxID=121162 RepID=UPI00406D6BA0
MRVSHWYLFLLILFYIQVRCIANFRDHLVTKTPYRFIENDNVDVGPYPGCEIQKSWMMIRHGSRYPNEEVLDFMQNTLPDLRDDILKFHNESKGHFNEYQLSIFKKWSPLNISMSEEKYLSNEGRIEMERLASRMQLRFGKIMPKHYSNRTYIFKHTPTERALESAKHFAIGLFGESVAKNVTFIKTAKNDPVLRFYKGCKYWEKFVKKNYKTYEQFQLYNGGDEMANALKNISEILGFNEPLLYGIAKLLYKTCAFEQSFWGEDYVSPWCFFLTDESIQALEYSEDLKYYWVDGYGFPITQKLACTVLKDIAQFFFKNSYSSTFQYSHSGTILKILSYFGLYNTDGVLKSNNRDPNRSWRTSYIDSFASNIGFILYRCGDVDKVLVLHQERPVRLPECEEELCPLVTILKARKESLIKCDIKKMCSLLHEEL